MDAYFSYNPGLRGYGKQLKEDPRNRLDKYFYPVRIFKMTTLS